ncbi:MAG: IclR family transcriptional regulator [Actinomycetota bacterium]|nr:IclR family transcriptional regulator [Actinomycetota bacterium]
MVRRSGHKDALVSRDLAAPSIVSGAGRRARSGARAGNSEAGANEQPGLDARRGSQAVDRALSILWLFDEQNETLSVGEIATAVGVHRSTAWRLLGALQRAGLVELEPMSGRFRLGIALVSLAGHVLDRFPERASGRKVLTDLRDQLEETVYLGVLDGTSVVYIDQASSPHVRHHVDWVGHRQSLNEGVTGALLLAFQPPEVIAELMDAAPARREVHDRHLDERALTAVRDRGYLARSPDPLSGLTVVSAPVRNHRSEVVAAITTTAPQHRADRERLDDEFVPATLQAAALISEALGYTRA